MRRRIFEAIGNDHFSRPSLAELDRKLERYLDFDEGFFVEAGANDGYVQSNTYYFERLRRWRGVLIEPIPELYKLCREIRHRSKVFNAALVADDFGGATITIHYADLMSVTDGGLGSEEALQQHLRDAAPTVRDLGVKQKVTVPARTLSSILLEAGAPAEIDLLSLDVEGYEAHALRGLDLRCHRPRFMLIEVRDEAAIEAVLLPSYEKLATLTDWGAHRDVLYRLRQPAVERTDFATFS
jgi:FkbM family methyltransferase